MPLRAGESPLKTRISSSWSTYRACRIGGIYLFFLHAQLLLLGSFMEPICNSRGGKFTLPPVSLCHPAYLHVRGFLIIVITSTIFTFPNGILWGIANMQVGMAFLSEVIAGALFPGRPLAVLSCMVYGRQILEQNLNLVSDYKFGFYMKIPEKEMFIGQVWGTLVGPFINYGMMRKISHL